MVSVTARTGLGREHRLRGSLAAGSEGEEDVVYLYGRGEERGRPAEVTGHASPSGQKIVTRPNSLLPLP